MVLFCSLFSRYCYLLYSSLAKLLLYDASVCLCFGLTLHFFLTNQTDMRIEICSENARSDSQRQNSLSSSSNNNNNNTNGAEQTICCEHCDASMHILELTDHWKHCNQIPLIQLLECGHFVLSINANMHKCSRNDKKSELLD